MKDLLLLLLLGTTAFADISVEFSERIMPLLHNYCYDCHDPDDEEHGAPFFEAKSVEDINKERHSCFVVIRKKTPMFTHFIEQKRKNAFFLSHFLLYS